MRNPRYDWKRLSDAELRELDALLKQGKPWGPLPGPQTMAFESEADVVGFGGAAGGGKTFLALGMASIAHQRVAIFRENGTELTAIVDDLEKIVGNRDGYNGADKIWKFKRWDGKKVQIELGSFPNPGDEAKYRGRPHDLLVFDEAAEMRAEAPRFLMGWLRTVDPTQRCRVLITFNPPTHARGRWVLEYFAPWLDRKHKNPAKPGELRWFVTIAGKDTEVDGPETIEVDGEKLQPSSRTFIPSRITDNPFLMGTGYMRQLMSMPEPLRSQLLYGDFLAGVQDDPYQVIPTSWVEAAMARWTRPAKLPPMDSIGADVAMGGKDSTCIARRHGMWFDELITYPGNQCTSGPQVAGYMVAAQRDAAPIHIDLFGVGAKPYGHLMALGIQTIGVNVGDPAKATSKQGNLQFFNLRSQLWWQLREALDPDRNTGICLPNDKVLLNELCTPKWSMRGNKIFVEGRDEIVEVLKRSPDRASAVILGLIDTPKMSMLKAMGKASSRAREYDPFA